MASGPVGGGQRVQEATAVEMLRARCSMNTAGYSQHRTDTYTPTHSTHTAIRSLSKRYIVWKLLEDRLTGYSPLLESVSVFARVLHRIV